MERCGRWMFCRYFLCVEGVLDEMYEHVPDRLVGPTAAPTLAGNRCVPSFQPKKFPGVQGPDLRILSLSSTSRGECSPAVNSSDENSRLLGMMIDRPDPSVSAHVAD